MPLLPEQKNGNTNKRLGALLLFFLVVLIYIPSFLNGFIWDDDFYVTDNTTLTSVDGLKRIWAEPGATDQYYPLVFTSFWVEHHIFGPWPFVYHFDNVILHAISAVMLWFIMIRLGIPWAWAVAAIFALHPVSVESVSWVSERKNVLSLFFACLSLLLYLRLYFTSTGSRVFPQPIAVQSRLYLTALFFFACALLSKTVACVLPVVFLIILWWKQCRVSIKNIAAVLPFFVLGGIAAAMTMCVEKTHVGAHGLEWSFSAVERCLIAGRALWFYVGKIVWPTNNIFIYPRWDIDASQWWQYLFPALFLMLLFFLWAMRKRWSRGPLAAMLIFGVLLLPALGFVNFFPMLYSFVADHFQYFAQIALIALLVACVHRLYQKAHLPKAYVQVVFLLLLVLLGCRTLAEQKKYKNSEMLWLDTIAKNDTCWMAFNNLGTIRHYEKKYDEAQTYLARALQLNPSKWYIYSNMGNLYRNWGKPDKATDYYNKAIDFGPDALHIHVHLAEVYLKEKNYDKAIEHYLFLTHFHSRSPELFFRLGDAYYRSGDMKKAAAAFRQSLSLYPENLKAATMLQHIRQSRTPIQD